MSASKDCGPLDEEDARIMEIVVVCEAMISKYGDDAVVGFYTDDSRPQESLSIYDISLYRETETFHYDLFTATEVLDIIEKMYDG